MVVCVGKENPLIGSLLEVATGTGSNINTTNIHQHAFQLNNRTEPKPFNIIILYVRYVYIY